MRFASVLDSIGHTPLVELARFSPKPGIRIFAKLEGYNPSGSVKDRIARAMIEEAEASGQLRPGQVILEPSSGNTGIALAMVGAIKGYRVTIVMPENVSQERVQLLEAYGAEIVSSEGELGTNGSIAVAQKLAEDPRYFMPYQYGNAANPGAHYATTAPEILEDMGDLPVDVFVGGMGTGGTLMGVARRLKEHRPSTRVIAVEPHPGDSVQGLRSLAEGFIPPIIDLSLLDGKMLCASRDAFVATRELLRREGLFAGVSSGAVIHGALRVAQRLEQGNIVCLLADGGWKYLSTGLWTKELDELERTLEGQVLW